VLDGLVKVKGKKLAHLI